MLHDWTILIATLGRRAAKLASLLEILMPQVDAACGQARIVALRNHGERPLGRVRQDLMESVETDYFCFVDDDDMVPGYYVRRITQELRASPDYIGFPVHLVMDGIPSTMVAYHSLRHHGWFENGGHYYRDITHLNPVRRDRTLGTSFCTGWPEDRMWVDQMRGRLKTEKYIEEPMYFYHHTSWDSVQHQVPERVNPGHHNHYPLNIVSPNFSWHPAST